MRHSKSVKLEASQMIDAMRKGNMGSFDFDVFGLNEREDTENLIRKAREYQKIQEHDCNGTKTDRMTAREENLEREIRAIALKFGLTVHFDGDPRGFCVKLHAPEGNIYNTWGGAESGYGIGENE